MIIVFLIFLVLSFLLAIKKPTYFVVFYLLSSTKFLGFFDITSTFVIAGTGLAFPMLNIITLFAVFFSYNWYKIEKKDFYFIFSFLLFLLVGIIYPLYLGYETLQQAITASKEFWIIFFFMYLITYKNSINSTILLKSIKYIGLYISCIYILYFLFNIGPPNYISETHVRAYFPTFMSLTLFLYYVEYQELKITKTKFIYIMLLLFVGIILADHLSLVIGTIFSLLFLNFLYNKNKFTFSNFLIKSIILVFLIFIILISFEKLRNTIVDTTTAITKGTDVALSSRDIYNKFRWDAIEERPYLGYGFIHKSAPITKKFNKIKNNRFAESFGVIDSGYVDILIKFGYIGTVLYLLLWGVYILKPLRKPQNHTLLQLAMAAYILQYYLVSYTWSVYTFSHGLIPAFIALYFIRKNKKRIFIEKNNFTIDKK